MNTVDIVKILRLPLSHDSEDVFACLNTRLRNRHLTGTHPEIPVQVEDTEHLERFRKYPYEYTESMSYADCLSTLRLITVAEVYAGNLLGQSVKPGQLTAAEVARTILIGMTENQNLHEIPALNQKEELCFPAQERYLGETTMKLKINESCRKPIELLRTFPEMFLPSNIGDATKLPQPDSSKVYILSSENRYERKYNAMAELVISQPILTLGGFSADELSIMFDGFTAIGTIEGVDQFQINIAKQLIMCAMIGARKAEIYNE